MKGVSKFFIKGIYLILVIIVISIVVNRIVSLNRISSEEQLDLKLSDRASDILEILAGSNDCLAYEEIGSVDGRDIPLDTHRVLEKETLDEFSEKFADVEPDCLRDSTFGYKIEVETLPIDIKSIKTRYGGVLGELIWLINNKKAIFMADVSGSMKNDGGTYEGRSVRRIECLKIFLKNFIDELGDESDISIFIYGASGSCGGCWVNEDGVNTGCCSEKYIDFILLKNADRQSLKNMIDNLPIGGRGMDTRATPILYATKTGLEYGKSHDMEVGVILTDGCENCCGPDSISIDDFGKFNIPVHSIAFGVGVCPEHIEKITEVTDGRYFEARDCEDLIGSARETINVEINPEKWVFGTSTFSRNEAFEKGTTITIPVVIYYDQSTFIPGKMKITLVKGELERFIGIVEETCSTEEKTSTNLFFHYPVSLETRDDGNYICMDYVKERDCQRLACDKNIEFSGIKTQGYYNIQLVPDAETLKIIV